MSCKDSSLDIEHFRSEPDAKGNPSVTLRLHRRASSSDVFNIACQQPEAHLAGPVVIGLRNLGPAVISKGW